MLVTVFAFFTLKLAAGFFCLFVCFAFLLSFLVFFLFVCLLIFFSLPHNKGSLFKKQFYTHLPSCILFMLSLFEAFLPKLLAGMHRLSQEIVPIEFCRSLYPENTDQCYQFNS